MPKFSSVDVLFKRTPEGWTFKSAYPRIFRPIGRVSLISPNRVKKELAGGVVLMTNNSVDAPTSTQRKVRTGELLNLSFSVLRRNFLLLALAGIIPRLPWLVAATVGDALPIITESYDSLQAIGFPVGRRYVGLGDLTVILLVLVLQVDCAGYRDLFRIRGYAWRAGADRGSASGRL